MKVRYTLLDADPLMVEHIRRNIDFSNIDLLFEARKTLNQMEKSRLVTSPLVSANIRMLIDSAKQQKKDLLSDISKIFNLSVESKDGKTTLELYVNPDYFITGDSITAKFGRLGKRMVHFKSRQDIIDGIEKDLDTVYDVQYVGNIVENDGHNLRMNIG